MKPHYLVVVLSFLLLTLTNLTNAQQTVNTGTSASSVTAANLIYTYKPTNFTSETLTGWRKPANSTSCSISPGFSTVMFICDMMQQIIYKPEGVRPSAMQSLPMSNIGFLKSYPHSFNTDTRIIPKQTEVSTQIEGDLYLYSPTDAEKQSDPFKCFFSMKPYDIVPDWLIANPTQNWIGFRSDSKKLLQYMTYSTSAACESKIIDLTDNQYKSDQMCYNFTDSSITQITSTGLLERSINQFDSDLQFERTTVDVPVFANLKTTVQVISNAGIDFWAAANPSNQNVFVFKNTELFAQITMTSTDSLNYGRKIIVSEDTTNQPIVAIAYGKAGSSYTFIDLYKPFVYNGTKEFFLWQKEALQMTFSELDTLQVQRTGMLMWIDADSQTQTRVFCAYDQFMQNGACKKCPSSQGTLFFQQNACMNCYDMPYQKITESLAFQQQVADQLCEDPWEEPFIYQTVQQTKNWYWSLSARNRILVWIGLCLGIILLTICFCCICKECFEEVEEKIEKTNNNSFDDIRPKQQVQLSQQPPTVVAVKKTIVQPVVALPSKADVQCQATSLEEKGVQNTKKSSSDLDEELSDENDSENPVISHKQTSHESLYEDPKHLVFKKIMGAGISSMAAQQSSQRHNAATNQMMMQSSESDLGHEVNGDQTNPKGEESFSSDDSS